MIASKPQKPTPDFPLYPHASGKWAKKIDGRLRYFGRWDDPQSALEEYERSMHPRVTDTVSVSSQAALHSQVTLQHACNVFLTAQDVRRENGELSRITFKEYLYMCKRLCEHIGKSRPVESLEPRDFAAYRQWRGKTCNIIATGNEVTRVRTLIKWIWNYYNFRTPLNFGPDFKKASAKALRRHRRLSGKKLFTAEQIRYLLDEAGLHMRAMILLGINGGFGNADCATLPLDAVNLETGWIEYPRPKTEVERRLPLWPETVAALAASLQRRYKPLQEAEGRFFVMIDGQPWDNHNKPLPKQFRQILERARIPRGGFYWLRHTFETIAGASKDQVAVSHCMGHADGSMSAVYREEIGEDRLQSVVQLVRNWLFAE